MFYLISGAKEMCLLSLFFFFCVFGDIRTLLHDNDILALYRRMLLYFIANSIFANGFNCVIVR